MTFNVDWPHGHKTRRGLPARIIATDLAGFYPIVAAVKNGPLETAYSYTAAGRYLVNNKDYRLDLINAEPESKEGWLNIYPGGANGQLCRSRKMADRLASENRIACVKITYYEGEGL